MLPFRGAPPLTRYVLWLLHLTALFSIHGMQATHVKLVLLGVPVFPVSTVAMDSICCALGPWPGPPRSADRFEADRARQEQWERERCHSAEQEERERERERERVREKERKKEREKKQARKNERKKESKKERKK